MLSRLGGILVLCLSVSFCAGPENGYTDTTTTPDTPAVDPGPEIPLGAVTGRIVNGDGEPLANIKVLCCTSSICETGETLEDGSYIFEQLEVEPRKMQAADLTKTYMELIFYQDVIADQMNTLSRDVVLTRRNDEPTTWLEDIGGTVSLAGGELELQAGPESVDYPFGIFDELIQGETMAGSILPPYGTEPWLDQMEQSFGYVFYPVHIITHEPVSFVIRRDGLMDSGTIYRIWAVDPDDAELIDSGTATVGDDGDLASDPDSTLTDLTTIILIPE